MTLRASGFRLLGAAVIVAVIASVFGSMGTASLRSAGAAPARQEATPAASYSCETAMPSTPQSATGNGMSGMDMGTPEADMAGMEMEFDQFYIDMMIAHHGAIVALAQAALPELTDERLQQIAQTIIDAQTAEQAELRGYREEFYGSAEPMPMGQEMMDMMAMHMPDMDMGMSMEEMASQMDPNAQVSTFCAAEDPDLTFIDLVIPHHEMAIATSEVALEQAVHDEIKDFAQRVIDDQQAEIEELEAIRAELTGEATPDA